MYAKRDNLAGIGFVFDGSDPCVGPHLDNFRDRSSGVLTEVVQEYLGRIHSLTEVSPSGTGVHIIAAGKLPEGHDVETSQRCTKMGGSSRCPATG